MVSYLLFLLFSPSLADLGVDLSSFTNVFPCIVSANYTFAIVSGYTSLGKVDPNLIYNLQNAWNGGMQAVDVYMFPCVPCGNPVSQATTLINALRGQKFGRIWVIVKTYAWSSSQATNQLFISSLLGQFDNLKVVVGIYTSSSYWESIVGDQWSQGSSYPLWYTYSDGNPSFAKFSSFGNWTYPTIKQFYSYTSICGANANLNFLQNNNS